MLWTALWFDRRQTVRVPVSGAMHACRKPVNCSRVLVARRVRNTVEQFYCEIETHKMLSSNSIAGDNGDDICSGVALHCTAPVVTGIQPGVLEIYTSE